ncbi:MAG: hypothetical protein HYV97_11940 [Bdellovibrio sp.]|nr:hypothetical protein [Bdellovibrio sp.]
MRKIKNIIRGMIQLLAFCIIIPAYADHVVLLHYVKRQETPAIPWILVQDRFEMGMSMYPSKDKSEPNQKDFYVYLYDLKKDSSYDGPLRVSIDDQETSFNTATQSSVYEMSKRLSNGLQHQLKVTVIIEGRTHVITLPFQVALEKNAKNPFHVYFLGIIFIVMGTLIRFVKRRVVV